MARKRTPDILGEALRGEFPIALKPANPPRKKSRKKTNPPPGLSDARPAEFMPFIRDILVELGPLAKEFIKGTVADALSGAIDVIADQKSEIAQLKTNVSELENRIGELARQLNELMAIGIPRKPTLSEPLPEAGQRPVEEPAPAFVQTEVSPVQTQPETIQMVIPLETNIVAEPEISPPPMDSPPVRKVIPESAQERVQTRVETTSMAESRMAARREAEKSAEDRYRSVLVKTIMNMRIHQGMNPVQIAERFENGGLKPLDGKTAWDAEMVKALVRGKRP